MTARPSVEIQEAQRELTDLEQDGNVSPFGPRVVQQKRIDRIRQILCHLSAYFAGPQEKRDVADHR